MLLLFWFKRDTYKNNNAKISYDMAFVSIFFVSPCKQMYHFY